MKHNITRTEAYLDENYTQEERSMQAIPRQHRMRNQQSKEHIESMIKTRNIVIELRDNLREQSRKLKLTKKRTQEVLNPDESEHSALKQNKKHQPIKKRATQCSVIQQEENPLWHFYANSVHDTWEKAEEARKKAERTRLTIYEDFSKFQRLRGELRNQLGMILPNEWNSMHTNELLDQADQTSARQAQHLREWINMTRRQAEHISAHEELIGIARSQLGTQELNKYASKEEQETTTDVQDRTGKRRKAKRTRRRKKITNKIMHAMNGNGAANAKRAVIAVSTFDITYAIMASTLYHVGAWTRRTCKQELGQSTRGNRAGEGRAKKITNQEMFALHGNGSANEDITPTRTWNGTSTEGEEEENEIRTRTGWLTIPKWCGCAKCPECGRRCIEDRKPPHMLQDCECPIGHRWQGTGSERRKQITQSDGSMESPHAANGHIYETPHTLRIKSPANQE